MTTFVEHIDPACLFTTLKMGHTEVIKRLFERHYKIVHRVIIAINAFQLYQHFCSASNLIVHISLHSYGFLWTVTLGCVPWKQLLAPYQLYFFALNGQDIEMRTGNEWYTEIGCDVRDDHICDVVGYVVLDCTALSNCHQWHSPSQKSNELTWCVRTTTCNIPC